jgi:hypothetical protein
MQVRDQDVAVAQHKLAGLGSYRCFAADGMVYQSYAIDPAAAIDALVWQVCKTVTATGSVFWAVKPAVEADEEEGIVAVAARATNEFIFPAIIDATTLAAFGTAGYAFASDT